MPLARPPVFPLLAPPTRTIKKIRTHNKMILTRLPSLLNQTTILHVSVLAAASVFVQQQRWMQRDSKWMQRDPSPQQVTELDKEIDHT
mmetsp:Transcript_45686/g.66949  ORF Transcript_45686/g.66949 Transcript_45686/m.66949 type:complete len:88 (-) Transcript_45686:165-428(-)